MTDAVKTKQCVCFNTEKVNKLQQLYGDQDFKQLSVVYKAIGHEKRLQVLFLISKGELCVCDLAQTMKTPISTVSQYLRILKHAGLIYDDQVHKFLYYKLTDLGSQVVGGFGDDQ